MVRLFFYSDHAKSSRQIYLPCYFENAELFYGTYVSYFFFLFSLASSNKLLVVPNHIYTAQDCVPAFPHALMTWCLWDFRKFRFVAALYNAQRNVYAYLYASITGCHSGVRKCWFVATLYNVHKNKDFYALQRGAAMIWSVIVLNGLPIYHTTF